MKFTIFVFRLLPYMANENFKIQGNITFYLTSFLSSLKEKPDFKQKDIELTFVISGNLNNIDDILTGIKKKYENYFNSFCFNANYVSDFEVFNMFLQLRQNEKNNILLLNLNQNENSYITVIKDYTKTLNLFTSELKQILPAFYTNIKNGE